MTNKMWCAIVDGKIKTLDADELQALYGENKQSRQINNVIGRYHKDEILVSTILLWVVDFEGNPQFETMIFGCPEYPGYEERYATLDEATDGHYKAVELVRKLK